MSVAQPTLFIKTGPVAGQSFPLRPGIQFIGRAANNDIVVPDPTVSKQHAQITVQPEGVWLQDLASANGTFVNGQRLTVSTWLKPGDTIQMGTLVVMEVQGLPGTAIAPASGAGPIPGWLIGGLAALVLVIVAALGVAGWLLWRKSPPVTPLPTPVPVITVAVTATLAAPEVTMNFTANKTTVSVGECVTLRWSVTNAKETRLDGEAVPLTGERQVCPQSASQTYRLTALTPDNQTTEQTVILTVPPTLPPPPGVEVSFNADQTNLAYGECTTLRWTVKNAQAVRLNEEKVGPNAVKQVCPTALATTYLLLVTPLEGDVMQRTLVINVQAAPTSTPSPTPTPTATPKPQPQSPVVDKLLADQAALNQGACTTLRWAVRHAQTVQLSGGEIGSQTVSNEGARSVCPPANNTVYTLTAIGPGGSTQSSITLAIIAPPPTAVIAPTSLPSIGSPKYEIHATKGYNEDDERCFEIQIYIENVKAAYLDGGNFNHKPVTGPVWNKEVCHKEKTTYTLTVVLLNDSQASVSVTKDGP